MASQTDRLQSFLRQGKTDAAVALFDDSIHKDPKDDGGYRERAHLLLYLGETRRARADFDAAARLMDHAPRPGRVHADGDYAGIGVTWWMEGHRDLAIAFWRYLTKLMRAGRVGYSTDRGVTTALLLWFGAVLERRPSDVRLVGKFYQKRLEEDSELTEKVKKGRFRHLVEAYDQAGWPRPLVRFFLKQVDEESLIKLAADQDSQYLCAAHFAAAIRAYELRRYAAYREHLAQAAPEKGAVELDDIYNTWPYFLARHELSKRARSS